MDKIIPFLCPPKCPTPPSLIFLKHPPPPPFCQLLNKNSLSTWLCINVRLGGGGEGGSYCIKNNGKLASKEYLAEGGSRRHIPHFAFKINTQKSACFELPGHILNNADLEL